MHGGFQIGVHEMGMLWGHHGEGPGGGFGVAVAALEAGMLFCGCSWCWDGNLGWLWLLLGLKRVLGWLWLLLGLGCCFVAAPEARVGIWAVCGCSWG